MNDYILFRYLHFFLLFVMVGCVFSQQFLLKKRMNLAEIKRIGITDSLYGFTALAVVAIGLVLWFKVGKGADFYTKNWVFHTKISLFIVVALLSIYPTVFYLKQRKKLTEDAFVEVPKTVFLLVKLQLVLLLIIPLLAVLMANGVGFFG